MTFIIQNTSAGNAALGVGGQYFGAGGLMPSVEVEFDIFQNLEAGDPPYDHVAFLRDGDSHMHLPAPVSPGFALKSGSPIFAWVEYRSRSSELSLYVATTSTKPATPLLKYGLSLSTALGDRAFVGFTAACGGAVAFHELLSLSLSSGAAQ
jgi:hypothetical protein